MRWMAYMAGAILMSVLGVAWAEVEGVGKDVGAAGNALAPAALAPATQPAAAQAPPWTIAPLRDQELPAVANYLYLSTKTTMADIPKVPFMELVNKVRQTMADNKIAEAGPCIMCYSGMGEDPSKEFEITIGYPVNQSVKAIGDCKTKSLPAFKCAATTYSGSVKHVSEAYPVIYGAFFQSGRVPGSEGREYYIYWEDEKSENNVLLIAIGSK